MKRIMIIRHAEKPAGAQDGVKASGKRSARSLTPRGWQRAGALVRLFHPRPGGQPTPGLAVPGAIFASRVDGGERSRRPRQTVKPLARALGIRVDQSFGAGNEDALAAAIHGIDASTLICWHHEGIPGLASMIAPGAVSPRVWPADRFDTVWVLQVHQLLLDGDSVEDI